MKPHLRHQRLPPHHIFKRHIPGSNALDRFLCMSHQQQIFYHHQLWPRPHNKVQMCKKHSEHHRLRRLGERRIDKRAECLMQLLKRRLRKTKSTGRSWQQCTNLHMDLDDHQVCPECAFCFRAHGQ